MHFQTLEKVVHVGFLYETVQVKSLKLCMMISSIELEAVVTVLVTMSKC